FDVFAHVCLGVRRKGINGALNDLSCQIDLVRTPPVTRHRWRQCNLVQVFWEITRSSQAGYAQIITQIPRKCDFADKISAAVCGTSHRMPGSPARHDAATPPNVLILFCFSPSCGE